MFQPSAEGHILMRKLSYSFRTTNGVKLDSRDLSKSNRDSIEKLHIHQKYRLDMKMMLEENGKAQADEALAIEIWLAPEMRPFGRYLANADWDVITVDDPQAAMASKYYYQSLFLSSLR